jgi:hypothetical protein
MSDCECPLAGFCNRYQRPMSVWHRAICAGISGHTPEAARQFRRNWKRLAARKAAVNEGLPEVFGDFALSKEVVRVAAESRGILLGDAIAELTTRIGIPPCNGCEKRKAWFNWGHQCVMAFLAGEAWPENPLECAIAHGADRQSEATASTRPPNSQRQPDK